MSGWDDLVGAEHPRRLLGHSLAGDDVAHAYLFGGPEGVGKRAGALLFAKGLLCENPAAAPCGGCASCDDVAALKHQDLLLLHGATNPLWYEPSRLEAVGGLPAGERAKLAALLQRLAADEVIGAPAPSADEKRRLWPIRFSKETIRAAETARGGARGGASTRIEKLTERRKLAGGEVKLARLIALPPLSLSLYRRGARGLGIAAIAPREGKRGRSVKEFLEKRPSRGRRKVAIVDEAHWMTEEAQNGLLKTLEEPPPGAVLILVTESPGSLLPTIRSRVRSLAWRALTEREMVSFLEQWTEHEQSNRRLLAAAAGGSPGRAMREDPSEFVGLRAIALRMLRASAAGELRGFLAAAAQVSVGRGARDEERQRVGSVIDLLLVYLRDLRARALVGDGARLAYADLAAEIDADVDAMPRRFVSEAARRLLDARARLMGFAEPRLVIESLFLPLFPREPNRVAPARASR